MDVPKLLEAAAFLVPQEIATENDITVNDVWDYLAHDEWEVALGLLEELGGAPNLPLQFWETMAAAAEAMHLESSAAWCRWRSYESRNGVIRAELTLRPEGEAWRKSAIPGAGVLRPLWNIGHLSPSGDPTFETARLWVEYRPSVEPGGQATVRLAPLIPSHWQHLSTGQVITMHEARSVGGTAVILDIQRGVH